MTNTFSSSHVLFPILVKSVNVASKSDRGCSSSGSSGTAGKFYSSRSYRSLSRRAFSPRVKGLFSTSAFGSNAPNYNSALFFEVVCTLSLMLVGLASVLFSIMSSSSVSLQFGVSSTVLTYGFCYMHWLCSISPSTEGSS